MNGYPGQIAGVEAKAPNVHQITVATDARSEIDQWFLLRSDAHFDNVHCQRRLEQLHLDQAVERDAGILDGGDLFCAMQGKWDRRSDRSQLRPEHQYGNYLDALVQTAADRYADYASNWLLLAPGNHEHAIRKHHETSLTERLSERMSITAGRTIAVGSYAGFVSFVFNTSGRESQYRVVMYRHHGYGGGGPVTRGVIQTNRMAVYLPDAEIVWTGHTHDQTHVPIERVRISRMGTVYNDRQHHVRTPGYKEEFLCGEGWHVERGAPPKPQSAYWLHFYVARKKLRFRLIAAEDL